MTQIRDEDLTLGPATRAVHAGQHPDPTSGAVMTPIYQTSTYAQDGLGRHKGYEYARTQNPTREALERNIASPSGAAVSGSRSAPGSLSLDAILKAPQDG
jgi:cystathionine beta-lyase/cystathionine gamma-synthase